LFLKKSLIFVKGSERCNVVVIIESEQETCFVICAVILPLCCKSYVRSATGYM